MRSVLLAAALSALGCNPAQPSNIPCGTNDNCPDGMGCSLSTNLCASVPGCGGNNGGGCFNGTPLAPTVSLGSGGANVSWFAGNTPDNASGFAVLRGNAKAGPFAVVGTVTPYTIQQSSFTDVGPFTPGATYWYAVATSWPDDVVGSLSPATALAIPP